MKRHPDRKTALALIEYYDSILKSLNNNDELIVKKKHKKMVEVLTLKGKESYAT